MEFDFGCSFEGGVAPKKVYFGGLFVKFTGVFWIFSPRMTQMGRYVFSCHDVVLVSIIIVV